MLLLRIKSDHYRPKTSVDFLSIMDKYLVGEEIQATTSYGQAYGSYDPPSYDQVQESGPPMVNRGNYRYNPLTNYGQPPGYGQMQGYAPPASPQIITNQIQITQANPGIVVVTSQNRPPDRILLAVLACFFCCWPTGIVAIVFAIMASGEIDVKNAWDRYRMANIFIIISVISGIVIFVVIAIVVTVH